MWAETSHPFYPCQDTRGEPGEATVGSFFYLDLYHKLDFDKMNELQSCICFYIGFHEIPSGEYDRCSGTCSSWWLLLLK